MGDGARRTGEGKPCRQTPARRGRVELAQRGDPFVSAPTTRQPGSTQLEEGETRCGPARASAGKGKAEVGLQHPAGGLWDGHPGALSFLGYRW
jgi:hypothetical protein